MLKYTFSKMFKLLVTNVLLYTVIQSQEICTPDNDLVNNILNSNHGSKINITMTNPTSIISCEPLEISNKTGWTGGRLILSDSPEYTAIRGKLYENNHLPPTLSEQPNRIFIYHVNGKSEGILKFAIFVTNLHQSESAILTLIRKGVAKPTKNYILSGQGAFYSWLKSEKNFSQQIINPLESVQLDPEYFDFNVQPDELLHGIYDYAITQNHKVTLCALEFEDKSDICLQLPVLYKDQHVRGTFPSTENNLDIAHFLSTTNIQQFPLAYGVTEEYISGIDATDGTVQINSGNYGIVYKMNFNISSSSQQENQVGYFVNPRGGIWAGAVGIIDKEGSEDAFLLPKAESGILRNNFEGALIAKFTAPTISSFLWMPTGGSNLPVRIVGVQFIGEEKNESSTVPSSTAKTTYNIDMMFAVYFFSFNLSMVTHVAVLCSSFLKMFK